MKYFSFSFAEVGRFNLIFNISEFFFIYFAKYFFPAKMLYSGYSPLQKRPRYFFRIKGYAQEEKNRELVQSSTDQIIRGIKKNFQKRMEDEKWV